VRHALIVALQRGRVAHASATPRYLLSATLGQLCQLPLSTACPILKRIVHPMSLGIEVRRVGAITRLSGSHPFGDSGRLGVCAVRAD
jgi:hypothetical protein